MGRRLAHYAVHAALPLAGPDRVFRSARVAESLNFGNVFRGNVLSGGRGFRHSIVGWRALSADTSAHGCDRYGTLLAPIAHGRYDTCRHRRVPAVVHCTDPRCEGLPGFADRHALLVAPAECYTALRLGESGHSAWSTAPRVTTLQGNQSSLVRVCYTQAPVIHAAPGYRRCS